MPAIKPYTPPVTRTRVEDYLARVDAQLATLDPEARTGFLDRLTDQWTERYAEFQRRVDRGAPIPAGVTAFDFIDTLGGLDQRAARRELVHG